MIKHHPDDELLLGHAAGSLTSGRSMVVAAHIENCAHCASRMLVFQTLGGALLGDIEPVSMRAPSLGDTIARIESAAHARKPRYPEREPLAIAARPALPPGVTWPRAMRDCSVSRWRWLGPGMRWSRVRLPQDPSANLFLLRVGAGKKLPVHTHSDCELTQVLCGSFHDGRALFGPGDFDEADGEIRHQPVVETSGECICLASVRGKVLFQGALTRVFASLIGM